jgi:hypothetical protein
VRTILIGPCVPERSFALMDPDAPTETEFECVVGKALSCVYDGYRCVVFGGGFRYDDRVYRPDLALVANDYSHWYVIEVELVSHSFDRHVLPQVRALRYGTPEPDCISILARELRVAPEQARTLIDLVPRSVAVIANRRDHHWEVALSALTTQLLTVSVFRSGTKEEAIELDGALEVVAASVGFGIYSATDRSLRFPRMAALPLGKVQIDDPTGAPALWTVTSSSDGIWVTKDLGSPDLDDGSYVQIIRTQDKRLVLRRPR